MGVVMSSARDAMIWRISWQLCLKYIRALLLLFLQLTPVLHKAHYWHWPGHLELNVIISTTLSCFIQRSRTNGTVFMQPRRCWDSSNGYWLVGSDLPCYSLWYSIWIWKGPSSRWHCFLNGVFFWQEGNHRNEDWNRKSHSIILFASPR